VDTSIEILGTKLDIPVIIAPMATHKLLHQDGEHATANAACKQQVGFTLSTLSSVSIEDISTHERENLCKWFQIYVSKNRSITESLVKRAENAGYNAIVLTVDAPVLGDRIADKKNNFCLPKHITYANFSAHHKTNNLNNPVSTVSTYCEIIHHVK